MFIPLTPRALPREFWTATKERTHVTWPLVDAHLMFPRTARLSCGY